METKTSDSSSKDNGIKDNIIFHEEPSISSNEKEDSFDIDLNDFKIFDNIDDDENEKNQKNINNDYFDINEILAEAKDKIIQTNFLREEEKKISFKSNLALAEPMKKALDSSESLFNRFTNPLLNPRVSEPEINYNVKIKNKDSLQNDQRNSKSTYYSSQANTLLGFPTGKGPYRNDQRINTGQSQNSKFSNNINNNSQIKQKKNSNTSSYYTQDFTLQNNVQPKIKYNSNYNNIPQFNYLNQAYQYPQQGYYDYYYNQVPQYPSNYSNYFINQGVFPNHQPIKDNRANSFNYVYTSRYSPELQSFLENKSINQIQTICTSKGSEAICALIHTQANEEHPQFNKLYELLERGLITIMKNEHGKIFFHKLLSNISKHQRMNVWNLLSSKILEIQENNSATDSLTNIISLSKDLPEQMGIIHLLKPSFMGLCTSENGVKMLKQILQSFQSQPIFVFLSFTYENIEKMIRIDNGLELLIYIIIANRDKSKTFKLDFISIIRNNLFAIINKKLGYELVYSILFQWEDVKQDFFNEVFIEKFEECLENDFTRYILSELYKKDESTTKVSINIINIKTIKQIGFII